MCGLVGVFDWRERRMVDAGVLGRMTDAVAHRGPDGRGTYNEPGIALGHRRLSIIDLAHAAQPMPDQEGRLHIVFNGEIYNFRELKRELAARQHRFRYDSDTEVLLEAWRAWGPAMVERLRGMFAFAIWDAHEEVLFLARDRFGVKPLYYAPLADGRVLFGSELKALLAWPELPRDVDPRAVDDFFAYGYVPENKSILAAVTKLPPAHTLLLRRGKPPGSPQRYWDLSFLPSTQGSPEKLSRELVERLEAAVASRLVADVEVAAFLSGGVDSSTVVALMAGLMDRAPKSLSIGFDVKGYDESDYARRVARRYATDHRTRTVTADDFGLVDRLSRAFDEPFADASAIPTFRVCELAREHVKVALSGDGADETMAGYRRYRMFMGEERMRGRFSPATRRALFGTLGRIYPKLDWAPRFMRAKTSFEALGMDAAEAYFHAVAVTPDRLRRTLFTDAFRDSLGGYEAKRLYIDTFESAPAVDALGRAQYADIRHWLPGDILTKVDRMSMANSLEAREPLLDHELVEWIAALPPKVKLAKGEGKWLLKKAMRGHLSRDVLYRPKQGFSVPISSWMRGPLADRVAALGERSRLADSGWFDMNRYKALAAAHRSGRAEHSRTLWQFLMLEESLGLLGA